MEGNGGGEVEGGVKVVLVRVKVVQGAQNCIFPTRASWKKSFLNSPNVFS